MWMPIERDIPVPRLGAGWLIAFGTLALVAMLRPVAASGPVQDTLDPKYVTTGATMTEQECSALPEAVWIVVDGRGDCIRYYSGGLKSGSNSTVLVWFHGDVLRRRHAQGDFFTTTAQEVIGYGNNRPQALRTAMTAWAREFGRPAIFVGRPGAYGSSGDHTQRRQPREIALLDKAIEALKVRHRIGEFIMAGQSGGGGVTAALLAHRSDIVCAVMTSGALAVRERIRMKRWPADATGANTFYDPIEHVDKITGHPRLRIFVVGDPRDKQVPFATQQKYHEALKARDLPTFLIRAKSPETKQFHSLAPLGMRVAGWCAQGVATAEIERRVEETSR
jgi:pimeloyl-ACP methyl ester carboxylesterase